MLGKGGKMKVLSIIILGLLVNAQVMGAPSLIQSIGLKGGKNILANSEGMTLYTFDRDQVGVSNCHDGCLRTWPAVIIQDQSEVEQPYGVIVRDSGELQLTLERKPLYTFVGDIKVGDINGDNLSGVWHMVELKLTLSPLK